MKCAKEAVDEYYKRDMWLEKTIIEKCHLEEVVTVLKSSCNYIESHGFAETEWELTQEINQLLIKLTGSS